MKPIEFITAVAENDHNEPAGTIIDALQKEVEILSGPGERWRILSYYYDKPTGKMILDIERY